MEITKSWKLIFILCISRPLLGCDVRWFGSHHQDNCRCSNESWYQTDSMVSHCEDDRKLDARCLSCFPHEIIRNESEESLNMSQTNFTKSLNTCPVKKSVEFMRFSNITNHSTANKTTKPDLAYTFQVDNLVKVISISFSFLKRVVNGEKTDKAKLILTVKATNDSELDLALTSVTDEIKFYNHFGYIITIGDTNHLFYIVTGVTLAGSSKMFRVGQKNAQVFTLKKCDRSGKCVNWNENVSIRMIVILIDLKETSIAVIGVTIFIATVLFLNIWQRRRRLNQLNQLILNQQQLIAAILELAAPAG